MWLWKRKVSKQPLSASEEVSVRSLALQFALSSFPDEPDKAVDTAVKYKEFLLGQVRWREPLIGKLTTLVEKSKLVIEEKDEEVVGKGK